MIDADDCLQRAELGHSQRQSGRAWPTPPTSVSAPATRFRKGRAALRVPRSGRSTRVGHLTHELICRNPLGRRARLSAASTAPGRHYVLRPSGGDSSPGRRRSSRLLGTSSCPQPPCSSLRSLTFRKTQCYAGPELGDHIRAAQDYFIRAASCSKNPLTISAALGFWVSS